MAENKEKENNKDLQIDEDHKTKKKLLLIIGAVVIFFIVGFVSYWLFFVNDDVSLDSIENKAVANSTQISSESAVKNVEVGTALYVPMPRPFRFNIPGAARDRFVEIRVQLMVRGTDNDENAKKHIPLIESTLLSVFSRANADDLATSAGKASLKQKSLSEVQKVMKEIEGNRTIEKVLFTGFVMQ
jgi:flagellar FliL protein